MRFKSDAQRKKYYADKHKKIINKANEQISDIDKQEEWWQNYIKKQKKR